MNALPPELLAAVLARAPVARLAQLDLAGQPQAIPFVFACSGDTLWSPVDGKPKRHARLSRLAWISAHPEVTVLVDHYAEDWASLWWLRLRGLASTVHEDAPEFGTAVDSLRAKYRQYEHTPLFAGRPTLMRIDIRGVRWWAAEGRAGLERWLGWPPAATPPPERQED